MTSAIEMKEIGDILPEAKNESGLKDQRSFRPGSIAEIQKAANYQPLVWYVSGNEIGIGCGNSVEDIGIILSCYVCIWSACVLFFTLLLKAAIDTDDQNTALHAFLYFAMLFFCLVGGSVYTGQLELEKIKKARAYRRAEALKAEGIDASEAEAAAE